MKKQAANFLLAVAAGICISIGGACFIAVDSKIAGALFFTVGLFTICTMGFNLFTGKVCYLFENKILYLAELLLIWLGNAAGTVITGYALRLTRFAGEANLSKAVNMCSLKLADTPLSIFILAVFCNILIYIAVESYKNNPHAAGKYIGLFLGVSCFILAGFEHCVANMFYFSFAGMWSAKTLLYVIVMTLGNAVGGLLLPVFSRIKNGGRI